jgi:TIR domain
MDVSINDSMRIFLSHKGLDKKFVTDFKETLQLLGYDPWIDEDAMPAGTPLERGLLKGMQDSCGAIFFITPLFEDKGYLATEVNYAIREKREKDDKFAIVTLQFADGDGNIGTIPELLKEFVWKTPKTDLEAFREIIRALPIKVGSIDWREDIKRSFKSTKVESLSGEARTILLKATDGNGEIWHVRTTDGEHLQVNEDCIFPNHDRETIALWLGGHEDLIRHRFIKRSLRGNGFFEVTREGYNAADLTRKES